MGTIAGLEVGLPATPDAVDAAWLTSVLRTSGAIADATSVATAEVTRFEAGGLLACLYRAACTYDGGDGPASLVLKFPMDIPHQRGMADAFQVYIKEVAWYRDIAPRCSLRSPRVHAAMVAEDASNYCLVMEDLGDLYQPDPSEGLTIDQAMTAITALANYHADFYRSDELASLEDPFFTLESPVYVMGLPGVHAAGWENAKRYAGDQLSAQVIELGDRFVELLPGMLAHLNRDQALCHHDFRADNMFFDADGEVIVIDPQLSGVTNPGFDVGYFITQSLHPEDRQGNEQALIDRYHETMAARGAAPDRAELDENVRVAIALCIVYGFASFAEWENIDPVGQQAQISILKRTAAAIDDFNALEAAVSVQ